MLDPSYRLECLKLAIGQASPASPFVRQPAEGHALKPDEKWSYIIADEVVTLAQKYTDFLEGGAHPDMNAPADPEFPNLERAARAADSYLSR